MNVFAKFTPDQDHPTFVHTPDLLPTTPEDLTPTEPAPSASGMSLAETDAGQTDSLVAPSEDTAPPTSRVEGSLVPVLPSSIVPYGTEIGWKQDQAGVDVGIIARSNVAHAGGMADKLSPAWRFHIDAEAIGKISRITQMKSKGAPDLILTVGAGDLTCTATTTKGDFTIAYTVPLRETVPGRCLAFQIYGEVIARIGARFDMGPSGARCCWPPRPRDRRRR